MLGPAHIRGKQLAERTNALGKLQVASLSLFSLPFFLPLAVVLPFFFLLLVLYTDLTRTLDFHPYLSSTDSCSHSHPHSGSLCAPFMFISVQMPWLFSFCLILHRSSLQVCRPKWLNPPWVNLSLSQVLNSIWINFWRSL